MSKTREEVLDKHYPTERTVFRDNILIAMSEYAAERVARYASVQNQLHKDQKEEVMTLQRELKRSERKGIVRSVLLVIGTALAFGLIYFIF